MFSLMVKQRAINQNSQKKAPLFGKGEKMFLLHLWVCMASKKQTLEREYQTYRPTSISPTTNSKLSSKVLGEHHKDRAEERAARSDAKVRQNFCDNCSCCNPSPFHNYCQHPAPSGQQCNALTQHRLLRCNSLNIFRLPCWSPSWEGWTRPWKVFQIKVS